MTKRAERDEQIEVYVEQEQTTTWKRMYEEYKSNPNSKFKEKVRKKLKTEIISKQSKESYSLANIFKKIANENINLAQKTDTNQSLKLYYYNDAAIACQYTLKLTEDRNLQQDTYKILDAIQTDMVQFSGGDISKVRALNSKQDIEILCHRQELQSIRDYNNQSVKKIEEHRVLNNNELYINESAQVCKDIASGMQRYLGELYRSAQDILGGPPCNYAVIGLGSMALRQMTPYSDLECAILTENEDYKHHDNPAAIRNYFANLSHLVHFKIINLGETIIPTSAYNINLNEFVSPAVNFDLGGKTPLGRIEKDKPYELIQTVDMMLSYLKNSGKTTDHVDKNLASILQKVCFIHGNKELAKSYQEKAQHFLSAQNDNGRPNHEERAIKALSEGVEEIDYTKPSLQPKKIEGNLEQFSLNANKAQGKLFDVKQEIYRMPDRFVYNLGLIYGVQEDSSWDTIDKLYEQGIINAEGATNLKKALSFATNLRLKTYSHYGCQKDSMDFAKTYEVQSDLLSQKVEQELSKVFKLPINELEEGGALFEYYYTALALRNSLEEFCKLNDLSQKEGFFSNNPFYQTDVGTKAQINSRLLRYKDALKYQLEELEELKQSLGDDHSDIARSYNNIGITYGELGDHRKALEYHEKALVIQKKSLGEDHPLVAISLGNIGGTYGDLGDYKQALELQKAAVKIWRQLVQLNKDYYFDLALNLDNLGGTYGDSGQYEQALNVQKEASRIFQEFYRDNYSYIANNLNHIGLSYNALGNYNKALVFYEKALNMRRTFLGENHPDVATSLDNIGCIYTDLGQYEKALRHMQKALNIRKKCLDENHPSVATSLDNMGNTCRVSGNYQEALECQEKALNIRQEKFPGESHPDVANSFNSIGSTYADLNDHKKALQHKKKGLKINLKFLDKNHPDIATNYNNIGRSHNALGNYNEALASYNTALTIYQKSLGDDHPAVASSYNNIGSTYVALGNYNEALTSYNTAVIIFQKFFGDTYSNTIFCKYNIAQTYCHLSMYQEALAELAGVLAVYKKSNQQDKIAQCQGQIAHIKRIKNFYEEANKLLEDNSNSVVSVKSYNKTAKVINNLKTALDQFRKCSNLIKSDVIDEKILLTLDLLIKAQTSLYQNSTKNKLAIRKQLNEYQKEYDELKKSMDDKQVILAKIEEYLSEQKQIRDEQREMESTNNALEAIETNSSLEEIPEDTELVSLSGENHNEHAALNLN